MNAYKSRINQLFTCAVLLSSMVISPSALATIIFTEDFNNYTTAPTNFNGAQNDSGWRVGFGGGFSNWSSTGGNSAHAVDYANQNSATTYGPENFAVMIFDTDVLTSFLLAGSNIAGQTYSVDYLASATVYQADSQRTIATDSLLIEILKFGSTVVASHEYSAGAWTDTFDLSFSADSFTYVGDGIGDISFRISAGSGTSGSSRFAGAIDNLTVSTVSTVSTVPVPAAVWLFGSGLVGLVGVARRKL